jgi:hypothetical protein
MLASNAVLDGRDVNWRWRSLQAHPRFSELTQRR